MTVTGNNTLTFRDVLVGEVWLCSGQSNMQWTLSLVDNAATEVPAAAHPGMRLFGEGLGFRLRHRYGGAFRLARQGQTRGLRHVVLHVKQVWRVMDSQQGFGLAEQGFRLVTDHLTDRDRQGR